MWVVNEPTHYPRREGHGFPGVVSVFCERMSGCRPFAKMAAFKLSLIFNHDTPKTVRL